jgi:hypothetical protein
MIPSQPGTHGGEAMAKLQGELAVEARAMVEP